MGGFNVFGSLGMLSGFLVGGLVTAEYGFLAAFLVAGGLEITIAVVASTAIARIANPSTRSGASADGS